jgi:hypothetical protein
VNEHTVRCQKSYHGSSSDCVSITDAELPEEEESEVRPDSGAIGNDP